MLRSLWRQAPLALIALISACGVVSGSIDPSPEATAVVTATPSATVLPTFRPACGIPVVGPVLSCGTATIKGTSQFDFEAGRAAVPGASDVWWQQIDSTHRYLVPQNGASLANLGTVPFDSIDQRSLQAPSYSATRIRGTRDAPQGTIGVNSVVAVKTRAGHFAKMRIDSYGWDIAITWVTYP